MSRPDTYSSMGIRFCFDEKQISSRGGCASVSRAASVKGTFFANHEKRKYELIQIFDQPMRVMFLPEEIGAVTAGLAGELPELGFIRLNVLSAFVPGHLSSQHNSCRRHSKAHKRNKLGTFLSLASVKRKGLLEKRKKAELNGQNSLVPFDALLSVAYSGHQHSLRECWWRRGESNKILAILPTHRYFRFFL